MLHNHIIVHNWAMVLILINTHAMNKQE